MIFVVESLGLHKKHLIFLATFCLKQVDVISPAHEVSLIVAQVKTLICQKIFPANKNYFSRWSTLKQPFLMWLLQYRALLVWRYQNNQYDSTKSLLLVLLLFLKIVFVHMILLIAGATKWSPAGRPCHWAESLCCSQWSSSQWTGSLSSS